MCATDDLLGMERTMTNLDDQNIEKQNIEKHDSRMMWITTAVIILILVGGMGANMLFHHDTSSGAADSGTVSPK
jgi:hypothetical protein